MGMEDTLKAVRGLYPTLTVEQLERLLIAYVEEIDIVKKEILSRK